MPNLPSWVVFSMLTTSTWLTGVMDALSTPPGEIGVLLVSKLVPAMLVAPVMSTSMTLLNTGLQVGQAKAVARRATAPGTACRSAPGVRTGRRCGSARAPLPLERVDRKLHHIIGDGRGGRRGLARCHRSSGAYWCASAGWRVLSCIGGALQQRHQLLLSGVMAMPSRPWLRRRPVTASVSEV